MEDNQNTSYEPLADLGIGFIIPTDLADIKEGDNVLDLGSEVGNISFIARRMVGDKGRVIGVEPSIEKLGIARQNCGNFGYNNVTFILNALEKLPFDDNTFDVVISNCMLNMQPDKYKIYSEIFRVLKTNGYFCISDIVVEGKLSNNIEYNIETTAKGIGNAISKQEYINIVKKIGFVDVNIQKEQKIETNNGEILLYIKYEDIEEFNKSNVSIDIINIYGRK